MARPKNTPGHGHNSGLTEEDAAALQLHHSLAIRAKQAEAAKIKATYDEAREAVNQAFALLRGDLNITRKEMEGVLELQNMSASEFAAFEKRRTALLANQGLPVGTQMDLFPVSAKGDTADDISMAYSMGRAAGARGEFGTPPDTLDPVLHTDFLRGWGDIQTEHAPKLARAAEIIAERARNNDNIGDDEEDEHAEGDVDEDDIEARAEELKASDFMDSKPKAPENYDPLVVDGVRYSTKKLANEACGRLDRAASDARELALAE